MSCRGHLLPSRDVLSSSIRQSYHIPRFGRGVVREGDGQPSMVQMKGPDVLNWLKIAPFCIWALVSHEVSLIYGSIMICILRLHAKVFKRFRVRSLRTASHLMAKYYQQEGRNELPQFACL
eukprot:TRINITY_DN15035_c0_g1_i1.p1 TRINITY_DN15035_c0_g1~~TRINITY_DN15035_c0_g1_i1.p1  ORF type:complete len:121 (-),score=0.17 TRINITY_DN15035_c0_g1_i1:281-643(-)